MQWLPPNTTPTLGDIQVHEDEKFISADKLFRLVANRMMDMNFDLVKNNANNAKVLEDCMEILPNLQNGIVFHVFFNTYASISHGTNKTILDKRN